MLSLEEMLLRVAVAVVLGAIIGAERDIVGKEAGIRTNILVSAGASIFMILSIIIPYVIAVQSLGEEHIAEVIAGGGPMRIASNIVVGIGFLGGGLLFRYGLRVKGVTTAASVWFVAAIGMLAGAGVFDFAIVTTALIVFLLVILRKVDMYKLVGKKFKPIHDEEQEE